MNLHHAFRPAFLAATLLVLSCQDQHTVVAPESTSAPVAFRFLADGSQTPRVDVVEVEVSVYRDSAYRRLDLRSYAWNDSLASLQVPLHVPLRFQLNGILRRDNRDVIAWTASQDDTLDALSAEANVVTFLLLTQDTAAPDITRGIASLGADLVVVDAALRRLELNIPAGQAGGALSFPTALAESLYVDDAPVLAVDGAWKVPLGLGGSAAVKLVGTNRASSTWTISVVSGDRSPIDLDLSVDNGASVSERADTTVFTLPYVVDSAPSLVLALAQPKDRPRSLAFAGTDLDTSKSSWTIPLPIPEAGTAGLAFTLSSRDSLGNLSTRIVRIQRDTVARAPTLSWSTIPSDKPWGARVDTFVVLVVGGDSLETPTFSSMEFGAAVTSPVAPLLVRKDSVWWQGFVSLGARDSGGIQARVTNKLGSAWTTSVARIGRFDPAGPDVSAPSLQVDPLPADGWTRTTSTTLRGKAFDARSSKVFLLVQRASGAKDTAIWSSVDSSWSFLLRHPQDVDTTIAVIAIDTAGNASTPTPVRVRRDTRKPAFAWSTVPAISADTLKTNRPLQTLSVEASSPDVRGAWAVRASTIDTLRFTSAVAGTWTVDAPLPQGWSTWTVGVSDSAGNDSLRILRVLRDTIAPTVAWAIDGTNPAGLYAQSAGMDTLWISADTTISLRLSSTTGFAGVSVPAPSVDSAGTVLGARSSLTLRPQAGTTTTWSFDVLDALGNKSPTVKLVVVGLASIAAPVAKIGSSPTSVAAGSTLPWPKTVRHSCPDVSATLQGTSRSDTLIAKSASFSLNCTLGKIRSPVRRFAWSIADTASIAIPYLPEDSTAAAVLVDSAKVPWVVSQRSSRIQQHTMHPDTSTWSQRQDWFEGVTGSIEPILGTSTNGTRYFMLDANSIPSMSKWFALGSSQGQRDTVMAGDYILRGNQLTFRKVPTSAVRSASITDPTVFSTTTFAKGSGSELYARQAWTSTDILYMNSDQAKYPTPTRIQLQVRSGATGSVLFKFPADYKNLGFAARQDQAGYFVVGRSEQGNLIAEFYSGASSTTPLRQNISLAPIAQNSAPIRSAWEGAELWVNVPGTGIYRIGTDLSSATGFWAMGGAMGRPEPDGSGGVWTLAKVGSTYRLYHIRGSSQE